MKNNNTAQSWNSILKLICLLMASVLCLSACTGSDERVSSDTPVVFVSIPPQTEFVKKIVGSAFQMEVLVQAGQSPATYEPTPRQMSQLSSAVALFTIGVPFEAKIIPRIRNSHKNLRIVDTIEGVKLREMEGHTDDGHKHGEEDFDPHTWLDPENVIIQARIICDVLIELDPAQEDMFRSNLKAYINELSQLDDRIKKMLDPYTGRRFFVFHPSYGYFADAYGLVQVPVEIEGKEPGGSHLKHLLDTARQDRIAAIFIQPQFSARSARTLAEAIGCEVWRLDPLAADYSSNMLTMTERIKSALSGVVDKP
jgi:zinc transport system substrate-binding protein